MKMALLLLAVIVAFAGSHLASLQLYLYCSPLLESVMEFSVKKNVCNMVRAVVKLLYYCMKESQHTSQFTVIPALPLGSFIPSHTTLCIF